MLGLVDGVIWDRVREIKYLIAALSSLSGCDEIVHFQIYYRKSLFLIQI